MVGDIQGALPVSKDRNDNGPMNPIYIALSDGADVALVTAAGELVVKMAANSGVVVGDVRLTDGSDILSVVKDGDAVAAGTGGVAVLGTDGTAYQVMKVNADGSLSINDNGGSVTVDGGVTAAQGTAGALADAWPVKITDGTDLALVTGTGALRIDLGEQSLAAIKVSKDANANSETNPIFVSVVNAPISGEVHDFNQATDVAANGGTSNHDKAVTATKTMNLVGVLVAASGAAKWEVRTGPLATLATRAVVFTSVAEPTFQVKFEPPIEVPDTGTGTVRVIRTNREPISQNMYSTIIGRET